MGMDKAVPEKGVQFTYCRLAPCMRSRRSLVGFGSKCGGSVAVSGAVVDCTLLSWLAGSVRAVDVHATPVRATGRGAGRWQ